MATVSEGLPPPLHGIPTSKEKKYDRQLRLWAASGQAALEDAHLLLINSGPGVTGVETLKNLVLPGIGQFTIQDSALVTEADLGVNFFLDDSALNTPRAETTSRLLQELNPDVRGYAITEVRLRPSCRAHNADHGSLLIRGFQSQTACALIPSSSSAPQ